MSSKKQYQLNEILWKEEISPSITLFEVYTPIIAAAVKAGQFVVVRTDEYGERIPLTVADHDRGKKRREGSFRIIG